MDDALSYDLSCLMVPSIMDLSDVINGIFVLFTYLRMVSRECSSYSEVMLLAVCSRKQLITITCI